MLRLDVPRRATINESPQLARLVLEAEREKGPVEIDCSKTETYGPFGVALLASCFAMRRHQGQPTTILPPADPDALLLLEETGLIRIANGEAEAPDEWQVHQVEMKGGKSAPDISTELLHPLASAKGTAPLVVQPCLSALLENLYLWSESSVGGFVVVQWLKKGHKAKVAYVDRGVGIPAAVRRSPSSHLHRATDVDVVEAAFSDPHVTSRLEGASGQGLKTLRETVLSHHGKLTVVSLGAKVTWSSERLTKTASPALRGTAVELELSA